MGEGFDLCFTSAVANGISSSEVNVAEGLVKVRISVSRDRSDIDVTERGFVINGDTITNIDLSEMLNFHIKNKANATMASKVITNSNPYGVIQTKGIDIVSFKEKPIDRMYVNAGIYIFSQSILKYLF